MLREAIEEVLSLQLQYTSSNTAPMQRRGIIVRRDIPAAIAEFRDELAESARVELEDVLIEGRDGIGLKSDVPWVRFSSKQLSPSATTGWYVVLLHRRDGTGAYLALAHGSTQFSAGALVARSDEELARLMAWGKAALSKHFAAHSNLGSNIDLRTQAPLAVAYQKSCLVSFFYPAEALPEDSELRSDMKVLAGLLGRLYEADRLGQTPLSENPETRDAEELAAQIARPTSSKGQGPNLSATERRCIELHAMSLATAHLIGLGYGVKDMSKYECFDLEATRGEEKIKVEVKGTTGNCDSVLLTRNEVELHKTAYPSNALIVVHSISLDRMGAVPVAQGGVLTSYCPWMLDESRLTGISYSYALPLKSGGGS